MSIICIGQCAYDLTFPIQEPLIENQKYRIMEPFSCIGAPAANAAYLCALWNAETAQQVVGGDMEIVAKYLELNVRHKAFAFLNSEDGQFAEIIALYLELGSHFLLR